MNEPLVSVILPTRDRAHTVLESIKSVLTQTYAHLELIVVDDASTDDTLSLLKTLDDERVRVIALPKSRAASGARNAGIDEARGEWIAFHDSDDTWLPEKLEKQIEATHREPSDGGAVYTSYWCNDGPSRTMLPRPIAGLDGDVLPELLRSNFITTQTLMVRRDLLQRIGGFDVSLTALADWDLAIRIAQRSPIKWVQEPLVEYRLQPDSTTRSQDLFVRNYFAIVEKHRSLMPPDAEAWHLATVGNRLRREGNARRGRQYLSKAWRLHPLDYRYAGAWLASWLPTKLFTWMTNTYAKRRT